MTTLDAARLLIAAAGSSFVKDSLETLEGFGKLKPTRKSPRQRNMKEITLEGHLADVMQMLIHQESNFLTLTVDRLAQELLQELR